MSRKYPHISDTAFPDISNVNVYKYQNEYDYDKYGTTVKIKLMNVSWCGDYDNAVYFETKDLRNQWFDNATGLVKELPTMFRLYADGSIKVDLPIDECMDYNYVMIDYGKLPNQTAESDQSRMFYFINSMSQASVNATTLNLSVDYWTTFINDMQITYVNLLRGHAPMAETTATEYLANPIENSEYLLSDDVNYGEFQRAVSNENIILNDSDTLIGFLSNGNIAGDWEDKIPVGAFYTGQQLSAVDIFLIDTTEYLDFRDAVTSTYPQFWRTVKGMFVIPRKLVNITGSGTFCGYTYYFCDTNSDKTIATYNITKDKFGYADNIADIAKLYTFPYAAIEVNDFKGNTSIIKVEDTVGSLELHTLMTDMYPFLAIDAYMLGLGGNIRSAITFVTSQNNTFNIGGRYYDFNTKWNIPVFAVQLTVDTQWELSNKKIADAALANANRSASTAQDNANRLATAAKDNVANSMDALSSNASATQSGNTAMADESISVSSTITGYNNAYAQAQQAWDAGYSRAIEAADQTEAEWGAGVSAVTAGASGIGNAIASGMSGNAGGVIGSLVSGGVSAAAYAAQGVVTVGLIATKTEAGISNSQSLVNEAQTQNSNVVAQNNAMTEYNNDIQNSVIGTTTANTVSANTSNATINYNAAVNNASASYSTATTNAQATYDAQYDVAMVTNPSEFGQLTGTPDIISKPMGLSYNIVTQSKNAIRQAAEQFLRYGYMLNMQWRIDSFNLMSKFTYWMCDVVYCNDNGVYEGAQDMIKRILNNGVTIWNNPNEIGLISIYQNEVK